MRELDMLSQNSAWPPSDILKHSFWSCSLRLIFLSVLLNRYIFVRMYLLDSRKQNIYCILGKMKLHCFFSLVLKTRFFSSHMIINTNLPIQHIKISGYFNVVTFNRIC